MSPSGETPRPLEEWPGNPPYEIPKTVEAFLNFEQQYGKRVPFGLWYEVAFVAYLTKIFSEGRGAHVYLEKWGSDADRLLQRDALVCVPKFDCRAVDFTTNAAYKNNFVLEIDKRWFRGEGPTLEVSPYRIIQVDGKPVRVGEHIMVVYRDWWRVARDVMPVLPWP